jgi:hypothetical protein
MWYRYKYCELAVLFDQKTIPLRIATEGTHSMGALCLSFEQTAQGRKQLGHL